MITSSIVYIGKSFLKYSFNSSKKNRYLQKKTSNVISFNEAQLLYCSRGLLELNSNSKLWSSIGK